MESTLSKPKNHKEGLTKVKDLAEVKPKFRCDHCDKTYETQEELKKHLKSLVELEGNQKVISCMFQQSIEEPPTPKAALYQRACAGDGVTIDTFYNPWMENIKVNAKRYDFNRQSCKNAYKKFAFKPCIVAGSGPSLKTNAVHLKDRGEIGLVSCLHNYGFFEDQGIKPDYYLNLDSQPITISEMSEGGKEKDYWESTKDKTLVTAIHANPELHRKWKGEILFFCTVIPNASFMEELRQITSFNVPYSVGGNTLGACVYHAKATCGSNPIIYIGADFAFGYDKKFHSWDSDYDKKYSGLQPVTDVFGNRTYTWPSYFGFKCFLDHLSLGGQYNKPGSYINCTEGGILGAYPDGNIKSIRQASLSQILDEYKLHEKMVDVGKDPNYYSLIY